MFRYLPPTSLFLLFAAICLLTFSSCNQRQATIKGRSSVRVLFLPQGGPEKGFFADALQARFDTLSTDGRQLETHYNYRLLNEDSIHAFSAIIIADPLLDSLAIHQRVALQRYAEAGGGLLLADTTTLPPYEWHWYATQQMAGDTGLANLELWRKPQAGKLDLDRLIGDNKYDLSRCTTPPAPSDERFNLTVLDDNIYEPMQLEILPFGEVLFLERRGLMKLYDPAVGKTKVVHDFNVCIEGNYEDGLHGIALDPGYGVDNHWLYLYYSPAPCDSLDQLLSRFEFKGGVLDTASEKIMLRVRVQRESCCHSGGAVEFGPDGLLYLSTGDNTSSKESNGYSPLDERPGRGPYDAQKGSSNTHDLRGKILRIRPEADGTYSIPEGNLFAADGSNGRPEIFAMGCRNPFRISIDRQTNYLYWGDVGPDVGQAGRYGPESFDEWNQAREAGNFGWPYFVGDNFAYPRRDFTTDEVGELYDPEAPVNESPNNYGNRELPPARAPLMWYPYGNSAEFPQLGSGSRSAMAGPWYYRDGQLFMTSSDFPDYYEGKWFIYEWARSWIKVVTFDAAHEKMVQIEDFYPSGKISKPIDLKFGRDGALYMLEYGNDYFLNNPDARLVRISFSAGNRTPVAKMEASELAGGIPFQPIFDAGKSFDPDPNDSLSFSWYVNGKMADETGPVFSPVLRIAGVNRVTAKVADLRGATSEMTLDVLVGNTPPSLALRSQGNQSFLLPGVTALDYELLLDDPEDRRAGGLDESRAMVSAAPISDPALLREIREGKASLPAGPLEYIGGAKLIKKSDCLSCHKERSENVGPAYLDVAERYPDTEANVKTIAGKIITGGNGNWGERLMSGHPNLSEEDAELMVRYILSLNDVSRYPLKGKAPIEPNEGMAGFVLSASYQDGGAGEIPAQTGRKTVVLRPARLEAETAADELYRAHVPQGGEHHAFKVVTYRPGGYLKMSKIDLRGLKNLKLGIHPYAPGELSVRLHAPNGQEIARSIFPREENWNQVNELNLKLPPTVVDQLTPETDVYLVWLGEDGKAADDMGHHRPADAGWLDWLEVSR
ncbi:carbohydrate-binding protein [Lewinellaceae bacterium SD302]|nr:carbohydrate-binding protein [Lewinellaceae bacterium SD302]